MAGTDTDGTAIRSNLGSSILPKDTLTCELEELGIEVLIFLLVDDLFSHQRAKMRKLSANSHQRVDGVESTQKRLFNSFSVTVRDKRTKAACENVVKTVFFKDEYIKSRPIYNLKKYIHYNEKWKVYE